MARAGQRDRPHTAVQYKIILYYDIIVTDTVSHLNAATSSVGSFWMNPTVSDTSSSRLPLSLQGSGTAVQRYRGDTSHVHAQARPMNSTHTWRMGLSAGLLCSHGALVMVQCMTDMTSCSIAVTASAADMPSRCISGCDDREVLTHKHGRPASSYIQFCASPDLACGGIQGGKQLVLCKHPRVSQAVEQRGFACRKENTGLDIDHIVQHVVTVV